MRVIGTPAWFEKQLAGIVGEELSGLANPDLEPLVRRETADALALSAPIVRLGVASTLAVTALAQSLGLQASRRTTQGRALVWNRLPNVPPFQQSRQAVRGLCLVSAAGLMRSFDD